MLTKNLYLKFIAAQMLSEGYSTSDINFFMKCLPHLQERYVLSATEMGRINDMAQTSAKVHVDKLEKGGYLKRLNFRNWTLKEPLLRDRDLLRAHTTLTRVEDIA